MATQKGKLNRESTILKRITANDKIANQELVELYGNFIYSLAKKFTYTHEDAEDAVQEIFLEIWKHAGRFDHNKSSEIGFIALIAKRKLIDGYRKMKTIPKFENAEYVLDNLTGESEKEMFLRLDLKRAIKTLDKLQSEQKDLIVLSFIEGFSHTDIASTVGKPLGTVKSTIRRGLQNMRQELNCG
ncbi:sigma-70 family RNA polymerase sigma factor [soil metagenome]